MKNSPIALIGSITSSIQDLKGIYEAIAPLKNFLIFRGQRKKISELQAKIEYTETQVQELKSSVVELSKLIKAYAELIGDVRIAAASSDKFSELIEMRSDLLLTFKTFFANNIRDDYSRVASGIPNLPKPYNTESAQKLGNLEVISRNLRDLINQLRDSNSDDSEKVMDIAKKISSQYSDLEAALLELLREILREIESV